MIGDGVRASSLIMIGVFSHSFELVSLSVIKYAQQTQMCQKYMYIGEFIK